MPKECIVYRNPAKICRNFEYSSVSHSLAILTYRLRHVKLLFDTPHVRNRTKLGNRKSKRGDFVCIFDYGQVCVALDCTSTLEELIIKGFDNNKIVNDRKIKNF